MNPATYHPDFPPFPTPPADRPPASEKETPASHSFLEPRGEGILFAVICVLSSVIIYCGVLLIRFLA
jgi:hypothetical protein